MARSSPPGLCNVNNLAGNLFTKGPAHIPPTGGETYCQEGSYVVAVVSLLVQLNPQPRMYLDHEENRTDESPG